MKSLFLFIKFLLNETYREPAILFWAYIFPLIISGALGLAFGSEKPVQVNAAWISSNQPPVSESIIWKKVDPREVPTLLKRGQVLIVAEEKSDGTILLSLDKANSEARLAATLLEAEILKKDVPNPKVKVENIKTPGSRYIDFLIPGMIAFGLLNACLWGIGSNLVEMRTKKLLVLYYATPFSKLSFFLSFYLVRGLNVFLESGFLILFSSLVFQVEFTGSWLGFVILLLSGLFCFGGIGILVGSRTAKNQIGYGLINAVTFPMMLCSGIFFSNQGFPDWIQPVLKALPLTILADGLRSLFLEGFGVSDILLPAGLLIAIGIVAITLGRAIFRWV